MDKNQEDQIVNEVAEALTVTFADLAKLSRDVVMAVEQIQQDVGPLGADDRQRIAVRVLSGYIKLPFPFSMFQNMALKLVINYAVHKINSVQGHTWFPPVPPPPPAPSQNPEPDNTSESGLEG